MVEQSEVVAKVQRTIPGPPERVYRAWLDPEIMHRWFAPAEFTVAKVEVDGRVGGRVSVWQQDADGNHVGGLEATIEELAPGERIVLGWHFVGPDRATDPARASRLTVTFTSAPEGGTLLHLTHEHLGAMVAFMPMADIADNVVAGWGSSLDTLVAILGGE
nr:SRPBCC domain-containing protein [Kibdelosporangium sp. MJ126-NF4]CEL12781.1 Probable glutathione S-transferase-related transmembrane protein [Kibdelosporangium sp. MJ126-NF4]CTQ98467.1 Probable glutathione S-transferase-related transmembrane protein (EC 2.5.1.18) [Kibdelosporangium sp. MJ126-NF4]